MFFCQVHGDHSLIVWNWCIWSLHSAAFSTSKLGSYCNCLHAWIYGRNLQFYLKLTVIKTFYCEPSSGGGGRKGLKELLENLSFLLSFFFLSLFGEIELYWLEKSPIWEGEWVLRENFGASSAEDMAMILENVTLTNPWFSWFILGTFLWWNKSHRTKVTSNYSFICMPRRSCHKISKYLSKLTFLFYFSTH